MVSTCYIKILNCLFLGFPKAGHTTFQKYVSDLIKKYYGIQIPKKKGIYIFPKKFELSVKKAIQNRVKIIILVRNPYDRLFSGICDKHIRILDVKDFDFSKRPSNMNSIYKYTGNSPININMKDLIDFYTDSNLKHLVNNHFLPISEIIENICTNSSLFEYENFKIFKLEDNFIEKLNKELNIESNIENSTYNKKKKYYNNYINTPFNEKLLYLLNPSSSIKTSDYYRNKVYNRFKKDFILFNYKPDHLN